jgi:hypothetical protein
MAKRRREGAKKQNNTAYEVGKLLSQDDPTYLYREVTGAFVNKLNDATRNLSSPRAVRILERFPVTVLYPELLSAPERQRPPEDDEVADVVAQLGRLPLESLYRPVWATVQALRQSDEGVDLELAYPTYNDERESLNRSIKDWLRTPHGTRMRTTPSVPFISIISGHVSDSDLAQIRYQLPHEIELSPIMPAPAFQ